MERRIASGIMLILLVASMLTLAFNIHPTRAQSLPRLYVDPQNVYALPGESFTVDVMIADVVNLYSWQVNMSFNPDVLTFVNITKGDFLANQPEGTDGPYIITRTGWALFTVLTFGAYPGVNGSGTLATVEFNVKALGESVLGITHSMTKLVEMHFPPYPPGEPQYELIPYTAENGYFNNIAAAVSSTLDIKPDTLYVDSEGRWITAYVELPETYSVDAVDVSSIMLNWTIPAEPEPAAIWDYDGDGIPDLMVKFDRVEVESYVLDRINLRDLAEARFVTVTLTITGGLADGTPFRGSDTVKIISPVEHAPHEHPQENVRFYIKDSSDGDNIYVGKPVGATFFVQVWIDSPSEWYDTPDGIVVFTISVRVNPEILEPVRALTVPDLDSDGWSDGFLGEFCKYKEWTLGMIDLSIGGAVNKTDGTISGFAVGIAGWGSLGVGAGGSGMLMWFEFKSKSATEYSPIDLIEEGIDVDARYTNARGETYSASVVEDGHYNYPPKL